MSSLSLSAAVAGVVSAARGDKAGAVGANLLILAEQYAKNGGAKNALQSARDGIREGRRSIAAETLPGLTLAALDEIEKTGAEAGARPGAGAMDARETAAAAFAGEIRDTFLARVAAVSEARKEAAKARVKDKGTSPKGETSETSETSETPKAQTLAGVIKANPGAALLAALRSANSDMLAATLAAHEDMARMVAEALNILATQAANDAAEITRINEACAAKVAQPSPELLAA